MNYTGQITPVAHITSIKSTPPPLLFLIVCVLTVGTRHEDPPLLRGNFRFSLKSVKKLSSDLCLEMPNFSMGWGVSHFFRLVIVMPGEG